MKYIISDYSKWSKLFEAESPGRTKQTAGMGQRVVGIPIDEKSFKIKIIRDLDVLDASGKMSNEAWTSILNWIKAQPKWLPYYPGLGDLKTNFVIYSVNKDNDRKQLITFTISPRASAPGLPENVQIVRQEDLASVISDASKANILANTAQSAASKKVDTTTTASTASATYKLAAPISFEDAQKSTKGQPTYEAVKKAYLNLIKDPEIQKIPLFVEVKKELKAGTLGKNSITLIKAIIAGFGIKDEYGDLVEEVNQQVIDSLVKFSGEPVATATKESRTYRLTSKRLFEEEAAAPAPAAPTVPAGFDMAAFKAALGSTAAVTAKSGITIPAEGIKKGAKGVAEVGKVQQLIIDKFSKVLGEDPTFKKFIGYGADNDYGNTTAAVVGMIKNGLTDPDFPETDGNIITQAFVDRIASEKIQESYLGLNGRLVEGFDVAKAKGGASSSTKTPSGESSKASGGESSSSSSKSTSTGKVDRTMLEDLDEKIINLVSVIKTFVETEQNFSAYKSTLGDDEQDAWDNVMIPKLAGWTKKITSDIVPSVKNLEGSNPEDYTKYVNTLNTLGKMLTGKENNFIGEPTDLSYWTFKFKFLGETDSDIFSFTLNLPTGDKKINIDCDF